MNEGKRLALLFGSIPFLTLVFALPFVNRVEPIIAGLPFILFWIVFWVFLTPFILMTAYQLEKKNDNQPGPKDKEGAQDS
ncbi:MAG: DUF3311 domain-containing protein [Candidatus Aminicenantes bacterium]|nr:DUF3311 domain-containing protein [Candidatus Aminicenantes bacterium]